MCLNGFKDEKWGYFRKPDMSIRITNAEIYILTCVQNLASIKSNILYK